LLTARELSEHVEGCVKNNRDSQKMIYSSFYGYAMSICDRYSGNYDDAVEILNDGFLKIFKEIQRYGDQAVALLMMGAEPSWLVENLISNLLNCYRTNRSMFSKMIDAVQSTPAWNDPPSPARPAVSLPDMQDYQEHRPAILRESLKEESLTDLLATVPGFRSKQDRSHFPELDQLEAMGIPSDPLLPGILFAKSLDEDARRYIQSIVDTVPNPNSGQVQLYIKGIQEAKQRIQDWGQINIAKLTTRYRPPIHTDVESLVQLWRQNASVYPETKWLKWDDVEAAFQSKIEQSISAAFNQVTKLYERFRYNLMRHPVLFLYSSVLMADVYSAESQAAFRTLSKFYENAVAYLILGGDPGAARLRAVRAAHGARASRGRRIHLRGDTLGASGAGRHDRVPASGDRAAAVRRARHGRVVRAGARVGAYFWIRAGGRAAPRGGAHQGGLDPECRRAGRPGRRRELATLAGRVRST